MFDDFSILLIIISFFFIAIGVSGTSCVSTVDIKISDLKHDNLETWYAKHSVGVCRDTAFTGRHEWFTGQFSECPHREHFKKIDRRTMIKGDGDNEEEVIVRSCWCDSSF